MPVLMALRERFRSERPLAGQRVAGCLHVTKETAVLVRALVDAGAQVRWSGCNPLSTQDAVAAALAAEGVPIYAWRGLGSEDYYACIEQTLDPEPTLTVDDGADLVFSIHRRHPELAGRLLGGTEETTAGVNRVRAMAAAGALRCPVIAVNDASTKRDFDNVYGTGQSALDGIPRATSMLIAGSTFVVSGYGRAGGGCAERARGLGARVIVTEVDALCALRAVMDGFQVLPMDEAAAVGDLFLTVTGIRDVITARHFARMKDGAIVCNAGHYDCEIDLDWLRANAEELPAGRAEVAGYRLPDGRVIFVLAEGRLVNLAAAEGHPGEVMDMSFANQALALVRLAREGHELAPDVHEITPAQDREIAILKLAAMGVRIDSLTEEQVHYASDYSAGT